MRMRTYTIPPGSAEIIDDAPGHLVQICMTDDADVAWLTSSVCELDVDRAFRLDKSQCPFHIAVPQGAVLVVHSPAQGARTIQVSVLVGVRDGVA